MNTQQHTQQHIQQQVPAPNLLPQSRITIRRRESALRNWTFILIALGLLVALPSAMLSVHLRTTKPVDTDHVTRFVNDLQELQATIPPLKKRLVELELASKSQQLAKSRIQWTSVLNHLASLAGEHVRIHDFNASIESTGPSPRIDLSIQIHTQSLSQAREFLVILENAALFDELNMQDSRRISSGPDAPVNSTIHAQIIAQQQPAEQKP